MDNKNDSSLRRFFIIILAFLGFVFHQTLKFNRIEYFLAQNKTHILISEKNGATCTSFDELFIWEEIKQKLASYDSTSIFVLLGGYHSIELGAKKVLASSMLISSILTILVPISIRYDYKLLILISNFLTRSGHGYFLGSMFTLGTKWIGPAKRSRIVGLALAGEHFAYIIDFFILINDNWSLIFYIIGTVGFVWFILWIIIGSETPNKQEIISKTIKIKFSELLKSKSLWALCLAHFASSFVSHSIFDLLQYYPNYYLIALPFFILYWLIFIVSSWIGEKLIKEKTFSITNVRKIFTILGFLFPMSAVICLNFIESFPLIFGVILIIGLASTAFGSGAGFMVNHFDLADQYAGFVFGWVSFIGFIFSLFIEIVLYLTFICFQMNMFRVIGISIALVYLIGTIGYVLLGSGKQEPWVTDKKDKLNEDIELEYAN